MDNLKTPEELLSFMSKNINYGYLGKNNRIYCNNDIDFSTDWYEQYILETSSELLNNLCGTCWDQVEFEREWFLKNNYEIETIFEMVALNYENDYPTHSFLIYKDDKNNWCWFENADSDNRGIHRFFTREELLKYQYDKYIDNLKKSGIREEELTKIIIRSFKKPEESISAYNYIKHVINSKEIVISKEK